MEIFLAASPLSMPTGGGFVPVWAGACTGARLRICSSAQCGGYLMILPGGAVPDAGIVARDIIRLCLQREYRGVLLDFCELRNDLQSLCRALEPLCREYGIHLAVPAVYAPFGGSLVCIPGSLSRGCLEEHYHTAARKYGADRILLDLERLRRDYLLPVAADGHGRPLSRNAFAHLSSGCTRYYSTELCARYFTYRSGSQSHYVVYDDADTLHGKMALAEKAGIQKALMMQGEIVDLWPL